MVVELSCPVTETYRILIGKGAAHYPGVFLLHGFRVQGLGFLLSAVFCGVLEVVRSEPFAASGVRYWGCHFLTPKC